MCKEREKEKFARAGEPPPPLTGCKETNPLEELVAPRLCPCGLSQARTLLCTLSDLQQLRTRAQETVLPPPRDSDRARPRACGARAPLYRAHAVAVTQAL